jgi:hypothetical protein
MEIDTDTIFSEKDVDVVCGIGEPAPMAGFF